MDYILIRAWCQFQGLPASVTNAELAMAREERAPGNALYKRFQDATWATIEDYKGIDRVTIERMAAEIQRRDNPQHPYVVPRTIIDSTGTFN